MDDKPLVPNPPPVQITIPPEDLQRLEAWRIFFRDLSPRVKVLLTKDNEFEAFLPNAERELRRRKTIQKDYELIGWPEEERIAFVVLVNSTEPGSIFVEYALNDVFFFCFGDIAFGVTHFEWDGDAEESNWATSYSLGSYSPEALSWSYIQSIIVNRVANYENRVPPLPAKKEK